MFESANYLLQSKFTGTVIILPLIIEKYHRNKDTMKQNVGDNHLAELCHRLKNTETRFEKNKLDNSRLPLEHRVEKMSSYSNANFLILS